MRKLRLVLGGLAATVLAFLLVTSAGAAPKNATLLDLDCDDEEVQVLVQLNSSGAAVFDVSGEGGRAYLVQSLDFRAYEGELDDEPDGEPDFSFLKEYGMRGGFSETLECSGSFSGEEEFGTFTAFFDVTLVAK